tara:strand:+ start:36 stop:170 length:135 start_codon:yes stop_codon:yes gene_type:complete
MILPSSSKQSEVSSHEVSQENTSIILGTIFSSVKQQTNNAKKKK